jgi:hypothetical protein
MRQKGGAETFQIVIPNISENSGTAASATTSAAGAIGDESIAITMTGTVKAGGMVKFASHSKVYMIVSDLSGSGTLEFAPPLIAAVGITTAVTVDGVPFTVRQKGTVQKFAHPQFDTFNFQIDLMESA